MKRLKEITDIYYGPHHKSLYEGNIKYFTASHFNDLFQPSNFKDSYINECSDDDKYMLKPNDVIVTGKGHKLFAWAYNPKYGKVVPSSLFYILRIKSNIIKGEYLADVLNTAKFNQQLKAISAGTSMPSIQKGELSQLEIMIPPLKKQEEIINLARLMDEDVKLASLILEQKKNLNKSILNKVINEKIDIADK
jgi:restriction endonuclease S subunit